LARGVTFGKMGGGRWYGIFGDHPVIISYLFETSLINVHNFILILGYGCCSGNY